MPAKVQKDVPPITVTVPQAVDRSNLSRAYLYLLMKSGRLDSTKVGRRRLIVYASLEKLLTGKAA